MEEKSEKSAKTAQSALQGIVALRISAKMAPERVVTLHRAIVAWTVRAKNGAKA